MEAEKKLTGYPSIDKPWLKYYTAEAINAPLPECTIYEYLWENNKDHLDDVALIYFGKKITYGELFDNIDKTARAFSAIGVKPGDIVTFLSTNTPETLYCLFALNRLGAISNLNYVTLSQEEVLSDIERTNSKTVIIFAPLLPKYKNIVDDDRIENTIVLPAPTGENSTEFARFIENGKNAVVNEYAYHKNTPAVIVHSGGTTGTPKGVVLSNENLNYLPWAFLNQKSDFYRHDTYMAYIPIFHAFGLGMGIMMPLCKGMQDILSIQYDETNLLNDFCNYKPNNIMAGASNIPGFMSDSRIRAMDLSFFKTCGFGGSPIANAQETALVDFFKERNSTSKVCIGYGMSELASAACCEENWFYGKVGSVGVPMLGASVKVMDTDTNEELTYGKVGELWISSPGVMLEYYRNKQETENTIVCDKNGIRWVRTGDLGYIDEDGFVFVTGRLKRIYSTRAEKNGTLYKFFPDHVTNIISQVDGVDECAVVCIPDDEYKNIGIAYVVINDASKETMICDEIMKHCSNNLPIHSIPKRIYTIKTLPKTQVGKVDYRVLEQQAENK